jgi:hypothetical protein
VGIFLLQDTIRTQIDTERYMNEPRYKVDTQIQGGYMMDTRWIHGSGRTSSLTSYKLFTRLGKWVARYTDNLNVRLAATLLTQISLNSRIQGIIKPLKQYTWCGSARNGTCLEKAKLARCPLNF